MMEPLRPYEQEVFDWLTRIYVQQADARQKSMGLQYTTAETHDLARQIAKVMFKDPKADLPPPPPPKEDPMRSLAMVLKAEAHQRRRAAQHFAEKGEFAHAAAEQEQAIAYDHAAQMATERQEKAA